MKSVRRQIRLRVAGTIVLTSMLLVGMAVQAAAVSAPTITSFSPTSGPVGTSVVISGTNFVSVTGVAFKHTAASFTVDSSTQITATVPPAATTGPISVTTASGTATSSTNFTVTVAGEPTISSFSPASGPVGTSVTITGTNLNTVTQVKFKNTLATSFTVSSTQITASVPSGAMTGPISVTNPSGTAKSATNFTVTAAGAPIITSFSPTSGAVGTSVTITGTNFVNVSGVKFHGTSAAFIVNSSTQITATVPAGATTGTITVTNTSGTGTSSSNFTAIASPTITSFSPTSGAAGASIAITGTDLSGATAVAFNGASAVFTVVSSTRITATVPAGATTGPISVTTPGGIATSSTNFAVIAATHKRSVSLELRDGLVARGQVSVSDGFAACASNVPVKVQRRVSGSWRTIKSVATSSTGSYRADLKNKHGKYRALAPKVTTGTDICAKALSPTRTH